MNRATRPQQPSFEGDLRQLTLELGVDLSSLAPGEPGDEFDWEEEPTPESDIDRKRIKPLTPTEFLELESASFGMTTRKRANERGVEENTISRHRHFACRRLGATSTAHAIHIAIPRGILPMRAVPYYQRLTVYGQPYKVLELIAKGLTNEKICKKLKLKDHEVDQNSALLRSLLGDAKNRPHLVRRAHRKAVF